MIIKEIILIIQEIEVILPKSHFEKGYSNHSEIRKGEDQVKIYMNLLRLYFHKIQLIL